MASLLLLLRGEDGLTTRLRSPLASSFVRQGAPIVATMAFDYWRSGMPLQRLFPGPEAAFWIVRF